MIFWVFIRCCQFSANLILVAFQFLVFSATFESARYPVVPFLITGL